MYFIARRAASLFTSRISIFVPVGVVALRKGMLLLEVTTSTRREGGGL